MSASQQESAALKWGGLAVLVAVAAATIVAVFTMLFGGKGQPNEQPRLPPANSRLPQDYWHALGMIEQGYRNAPKPDETLAEAQKYDEFTANCGRCADSSGALAEKLRALPIAGVDAELIDYSLALASFYQHKAALYRRVGQFGSDMKTYRSKIVGPAAFMRGLLRPDKAIDDLFGDGPDELRKKAATLTDEERRIAAEEERVAEIRASLRVLLTKRYGVEFR